MIHKQQVHSTLVTSTNYYRIHWSPVDGVSLSLLSHQSGFAGPEPARAASEIMIFFRCLHPESHPRHDRHHQSGFAETLKS